VRNVFVLHNIDIFIVSLTRSFIISDRSGASAPVPAPRTRYKKNRNGALSTSLEVDNPEEHINVPVRVDSAQTKPSAINSHSQQRNNNTFYSITPPDNNNVPDLNINSERETGSEIKDEERSNSGRLLDLEGCFADSFVNYSDSIDNNCILFQGSLNDSLRGVLDDFEGEVVSSSREDVLTAFHSNEVGSSGSNLLIHFNMKEYLNGMLSGESLEDRLSMGEEWHPAHLDLNSNASVAPLSSYNAQQPSDLSKGNGFFDASDFTVHRAVWCENIYQERRYSYTRSGFDVKLYSKKSNSNGKLKRINKLIDYFESTAQLEEPSKVDIQKKIFEEVLSVRQNERLSKFSQVTKEESFKIIQIKSPEQPRAIDFGPIIPPPKEFQSVRNGVPTLKVEELQDSPLKSSGLLSNITTNYNQPIPSSLFYSRFSLLSKNH
jgi:hypothetical protein